MKSLFLGAEMVFLGPHHHPIKRFRTLGFLLVVDNGIGARTFGGDPLAGSLTYLAAYQ